MVADALRLARLAVFTSGLGAFSAVSGCSESAPGSPPANGGSSSGGSSSGGSSSGGSPGLGGSSGASTSGGAGTGGSNGGAPSQGGAANGGSNGGTSSGGAPSNGGGGSSSQGGAAGNGSGGAAGAVSGGAAGAAASGCARTDLLFCDDFEKATANATPSGAMWSTSYIGPDMPRIVIDSSTAHSGSKSVSVTAPLGNFQSFLVYHDAAVLPRASGDFYMRAWVRLNRAMADHHNTYLVLDRMAQPGAGAAVRLGEQANMLSLTVGGDAHGSLSNADFSNDPVLGPRFTAQTWGCLEGYFNSKTTEIRFWLDDEEIQDFHHTDWPADAYDTVRFGFEKYAGPELTIWFDDVALSASRIGCR